jgi:hypothetical protein
MRAQMAALTASLAASPGADDSTSWCGSLGRYGW